jgi:hypothetical protein
MSHFSFTRTSADKCALDLDLAQSTDTYKYMTDNIKENNTSCFLDQSPFMHNHFNSIPSTLIDYENDLYGQTRLNSRCTENKFNPNLEKPIDFSWRVCEDRKLVPEYTRVDKPCNLFAGISINRFHPLCDNVQDNDKIHTNEYIGINSRNVVKDSYNRESSIKKTLSKFETDCKNTADFCIAANQHVYDKFN